MLHPPFLFVKEEITPRGDGNTLCNAFQLVRVVKEEITPRGDGNFTLFFAILSCLSVKEEITPRGDGNAMVTARRGQHTVTLRKR